MGIEAATRLAAISDIRNHPPGDCLNVYGSLTADFAHNQDQTRGGSALNCHSRFGILGQYGVQYSVGYLIANFVRVSLSHGL